jgi:signal transduction histidine kinase/ActR/RegA family two-component response regulator
VTQLFILQVLRPSQWMVPANLEGKDYSAHEKERWRFGLAFGVIADLLILLAMFCTALLVHSSVAPVALWDLAGLEFGCYLALVLPSIYSMRRPEADPGIPLLMAFVPLTAALGYGAGLIDAAVGSPVSVLICIALGASWTMYPARSLMAFLRPTITAVSFAVFYLVATSGLSEAKFSISLIASAASGMMLGWFGSNMYSQSLESNFNLNKALENALEQARAAVLAKGQFLANMSHELRTPLNGVIGMLSLFRRSSLDQEQLEQLDTIQSCGQSLLKVINDILDFSKIEAGHLEFECLPFSPKELAEKTIQWTQGIVQSKELQIKFQGEGVIPDLVSGDEGRLRQVLQNLLGNAVKFTEHGVVSLTIHGHTREGRPYLEFRVRDSGIGIHAEQQQRLFRPFSQADNSTTRRFGGTGLGLAICRELVNGMGGEIRIESEPGVGSTFIFALPFTQTDSKAGVRAPAWNRQAQAQPCPGARILLVEDNKVNRALAQKMLHLMGLTYELACHGGEAVQAYQPGKFDLILMDCQMPEMDGYEATQRIRALEGSGPRTPIVALTANALRGDRERALAVGMDDHLAKPYAIDDLQQMIANWLPGNQSMRQVG